MTIETEEERHAKHERWRKSRRDNRIMAVVGVALVVFALGFAPNTDVRVIALVAAAGLIWLARS